MRQNTVMLAGAVLLLGVSAARADVISSTPTLPVLGVPYASATGAGCFPAAGVCVAPGSITFDSLVSSTFNASGQDIVVNASLASTLTDLSDTPIGPVSLSGTIEQEVLGRTFSTETGSWAIDVLALSLSGPVLGHTLTLTLDPSESSTGGASIAPAGDGNSPLFRIDSFFDVFVELDLDSVPPLHAERGPLHLALPAAVPEPSTFAIFAGGLLVTAALRRRRAVAA